MEYINKLILRRTPKLHKLELSPLGHTWFIDLDGTILKHNGFKIDGKDTLLDGVIEFFADIPNDDIIIFVTSRVEEEKELTENFLTENNIPFHHIIYNLPYGERILINDKKPYGLETAKAINLQRDEFKSFKVEVNESL